MIYATERLFRLRGIRYVEFIDLANQKINVPLKYVYKKKHYYGIGYPTFERELYEALRLYNGIQRIPETIRHNLLEHLVTDEVRIFGFENVIGYLSYENILKLLLIGMLGAQKFRKGSGPVCLGFLEMAEKIEQRYEAVNDSLNSIPIEKIWESNYQLNHFFKAKTGITLTKYESQRVLTVNFVDKLNIRQKVFHMETITDGEQLKNYYYSSLRSLRKTPFHTDDYELELEKAFEHRLVEINEQILEQAKKQMDLINNCGEIHHLVEDLKERSLDLGFSADQRHRLQDLFEIRTDDLKRKKLDEINHHLAAITEADELRDYWDSIKYYLLNNRPYLGKEYETMIAKQFDQRMKKVRKG
jgi:hypothetical protein